MILLEELEIRHRLNRQTDPQGELARLMYHRVMADNEKLLHIARKMQEQLYRVK